MHSFEILNPSIPDRMPANKVFMVEPGIFYSNPQTASDNFFQHAAKNNSPESILASAKNEFHSLVKKLIESGIDVVVHKQDETIDTPDAVFPNNWFSTHPGGILVLYPMKAMNRRLERKPDIVDSLKKYYPTCFDFTFHEKDNHFLEGTGSLVIDHKNQLVYVALSERTNLIVLKAWSKKMNYELVKFKSNDVNQKIVYHTNVMMCLDDSVAIVCLESISDQKEKNKVRSTLIETEHELIEISMEQMHHFCGNCLGLENSSGEKFLVMSENAFKNFAKDQLQTLEKYCSIIHTNLDTIEAYGGGGARCMLTELY